MSKIEKKRKKEPQTKDQKLASNLKKVIQQFLTGRSYNPLSAQELMQRLSLLPQHFPIFKKLMLELVKEGTIELVNGRYAQPKNTVDVISGILRVHPRGFGFLQADKPNELSGDVFIPKHLTMNAVDGDVVEVLVNTDVISEKGPEGKVISILERSRTHMAGIIREVTAHGEFIAYVPLLGTSKKVVVHTQPDMPLRVGDRIVMEVIEWGSKESETIGKASHYLGHISDPSCDIKAAIEEYELRSDFSSKVIKEAQAYGSTVKPKDWADREDFRDIECFTIDPDTAKDYDDAIHVIKNDKGRFQLGVHIADVSHYVKKGTALDIEASLRCNSTYFPNFCLPMLPSVLSDNLCSLKPLVNRLAVSVIIDFDDNGDVLNYRIVKSVIKSRKRFTYKEAMQVLEGTKRSKYLDDLKLMVELCNLLKQKRHARGSIEFALPDLVVMIDEHGVPQNTDYIQYDITHQLVEEFALKANETVALHLSNHGKNLTYRVHDEPAEENIRDFAILARAFGFDIQDKPSSSELQKLFDDALSTTYGPYLATSFIRRMRLATYSPENIGHYGLALTHYCHFTSPIRRYIDLVVHRLLFGEDDNLDELELVAKRCSDQERISAKAETSVIILKKLRLLDKMRNEDPYKRYPAVVTRIKNFGFHFEVIELMLEGFLHVSELEDDYFVYEEASMRLRGVKTGKIYTPGNKIEVMLKDIDFILSDCRWYIVNSEAERERLPVVKRSKERRVKKGPKEIKHKEEKPKRGKKSTKSEPTLIKKKSVKRKKSI